MPGKKKTQSEGKRQALAAYAAEDRLENEPLANYLGASTAKALKQHLSLETVGQLLDYYPRKYLPRGQLTPFSSLAEGQEASLIARVVRVSTRSMASRRGALTEVTISDQLADGSPHPAAQQTKQLAYNPRLQSLATPSPFTSAPGSYPDYQLTPVQQTMTLTFFNAWTAARDLKEGDQVLFSGKVGSYRGQLTLTNPHYAVLDSSGQRASDPAQFEDLAQAAQAPVPVYKATPKYPTDRIAQAAGRLLEAIDLKALEDPLPYSLRRKRKIPSLEWTYRALHTPDQEETWRAAHHALRYREALILQSALARTKAARAAAQTLAFPPRPEGAAQRLLDILPYQLTEGQKKVGEEIAQDLASHSPMNRLLQGDVGSGKTLVSLRAMLQVTDGGAQAALLAPTEVLAEQHYRSMSQTLGELADTGPEASGDPGKIRLVLLTASLKARAKCQALLEIASGQAQIVIGTHALLAEAVSFARLGLAVVDEQHRFGVEQRDALRGPAGELPHRLVMTATPIPRTVAMTVFGELDISILDQLPAGRQPIQTHLVPLAEHPAWEGRIWARAREEIEAGHQVYVVAPKIAPQEESGEAAALWDLGQLLDLSSASSRSQTGGESQGASVQSLLEELGREPALAGVQIASLHGRMETEEKNRVMTDFESGRVDLLVSTTVVEVGVNVPNATLMIIMDADRFGISSLHQLRGRVGRGNKGGTCLLVTRQPKEGPSRQRLEAVASSTDGFELSRLDLEQRREGDILGAAQSGKKSTLKLLRALTDAKLIEQAREDAQELIDQDPTLAEHPSLARAIDQELDSDREAFLGRG